MEGKQIPFGNDNKKSKCNSRFPSGMTTRKASATTKASARLGDGGLVLCQQPDDVLVVDQLLAVGEVGEPLIDHAEFFF